jgi:hypothetical protein
MKDKKPASNPDDIELYPDAAATPTIGLRLSRKASGVAEALKAIRGPLFGLFLVEVDTGDSRAAATLSEKGAVGLGGCALGLATQKRSRTESQLTLRESETI